MLTRAYNYLAGANAMRLGNYYSQPQTLNLKEAIHYFHEATLQQHEGAWWALGQAYEKNEEMEHAAASYCKGAVTEVSCATRLEQLATSDNPSSTILYYQGVQSERQQHWTAAQTCYETAAQQDNPKALFRLGYLLQNCDEEKPYHLFIKRNHQQALTYYQSAAKMYYAPALNALLTLSESDPQAAFLMAGLYCDPQWSPHNDFKAITYYLQAAKLNHPDCLTKACELAQQQKNAQGYWLIAQYYHQHGVYREAVNWGVLAAEQGIMEASSYLNTTVFTADIYYHIAVIYDKGSHDVKANIHHALNFYIKAEKEGHAQAAFWLGNWTERQVKNERDFRVALTYFMNADKKQHPEAISRAQALVKNQNKAELFYDLATYYDSTKQDIIAALPWYARAAESNHAPAALRLTDLMTRNKDYAIKIATHYEIGNHGHQSTPLAIDYWVKGAITGDRRALNKLQNYANQGNPYGQFILGAYYFAKIGKTKDAINYCCLASEQKLAAATKWLQETLFDAETTYSIAVIYDQGHQGIKCNRERAFYFYNKAHQLQHAAAPMRLAELLLQSEKNIPPTAQLLTTALDYYFSAAQRQYPQALTAAITLVENSKYHAHAYQLAQYYECIAKNILDALPWYIKAVYSGNQTAQTKLTQIAQESGAYALAIATAYQKGLYGEKSSQQAYYYYTQAALKGEPQALPHLQNCAQNGDDYAQYMLGAQYFHVRQQFDQAITWSLRAAAQGNTAAKRYLENTDFPAAAFIILAKMYEKGDDITPCDYKKAIEFYIKAWKKGMAQAAYYLGQLTLAYPEQEGRQFNQLAWDYFIAAAQQGYELALVPLDRLALTATSQHHQQLAACYAKFPAQQAEAAKWQTSAINPMSPASGHPTPRLLASNPSGEALRQTGSQHAPSPSTKGQRVNNNA